jgi:Type II secretion system (T2SS), protein M subtype b
MIRGISERDRRALSIGSTALFLIVAAPPFLSSAMKWNGSTRLEADSLSKTLAREEASIRAMARNRDSLVARRVRLAALDSTILEGETPALAAATLEELISITAQSVNAQIGTLQTRIDSAGPGSFVTIQVQASVSGDWAALVRFLARFETGPKLLALRDIALSATTDQATMQGQRSIIRADVLVEGLARSPAQRRSSQ